MEKLFNTFSFLIPVAFSGTKLLFLSLHCDNRIAVLLRGRGKDYGYGRVSPYALISRPRTSETKLAAVILKCTQDFVGLAVLIRPPIFWKRKIFNASRIPCCGLQHTYCYFNVSCVSQFPLE